MEISKYQLGLVFTKSTSCSAGRQRLGACLSVSSARTPCLSKRERTYRAFVCSAGKTTTDSATLLAMESCCQISGSFCLCTALSPRRHSPPLRRPRSTPLSSCPRHHGAKARAQHETWAAVLRVFAGRGGTARGAGWAQAAARALSLDALTLRPLALWLITITDRNSNYGP